MRLLRRDMRGPAVRRWQQFLVAEGHLARGVDGIFGPRTERATRAFQRSNGLVVDGKVGRATRRSAADVLVAALMPDATPAPDHATSEAGASTDVAAETSDAAETADAAPTGGCGLDDARLRRVMPGIRTAICASCTPFLRQAMDEFAITTPARAAAFLAQLAHESGQLRWFEEIWGPTAAQRRYEPPDRKAGRLGNTEPGDGKRFKGRGPIQLTGRANYRRYGRALGVDLIADPPLAATKEVGFRIAGLFWQRNGLNLLADQQRFRLITRRINGGFNGLRDRLRFYERAKRVFGVPSIRALDDGAEDGSWEQFPRGLDGPGEVTPTAAQRSARKTGAPSRAAGTKRSVKPRRAPRSRKAASRQKAPPKSARVRTTAKGGRTRRSTRARTR
jgi:putative chitinase